MKTFADRLTEALDINNWNSSDLCEVGGFDKATVSLWKNGHREPKDRTMIRLAQLLNVDPYWLLDGEGEPRRAQTIVKSRGASMAGRDNIQGYTPKTAAHGYLYDMVNQWEEDQVNELIKYILTNKSGGG